MVQCHGLAADGAGAGLKPWTYNVRELRPNDVEIKILFCGICHTDLHMIDNDWNVSQYPMVPGHEIAGEIVRVGSEVTKFKAGDHAGVGCMIWSCRKCDLCKSGQENYCQEVVQTYSFAMPDGEITRGGYADRMVAPEEFVVFLPPEMPLDKTAPLLCAGITCWSPMIYFGMNKPGKKIGVIGLGGLGHMAVQLGAKFGNEVTVISTSRSKEALARQLGAVDFCVSRDPDDLRRHEGALDCIIDTVSADKPMEAYLSLLHVNGVFVTVGLPESHVKLSVAPSQLIWQRKMVAGSVVGSVTEMQEMVKFCTANNVYPMVEVIKPDYVNTAFDRLKKNDVKFRFVIDMRDGIAG